MFHISVMFWVFFFVSYNRPKNCYCSDFTALLSLRSASLTPQCKHEEVLLSSIHLKSADFTQFRRVSLRDVNRLLCHCSDLTLNYQMFVG